ARGTGGGPAEGAAGSAAAPGPATGDPALIARWGAGIRAAVERHKRYPDAARRAGSEGRVALSLTVTRDGRLAALALATSSGDPALDAAALDAVRRAGRFPAAPQGLEGMSFPFTLTLAFRR
ncbi:MAG: TonB family protein, partial [Rhodobacteraceae bacterium]|nr:TonB family protein [Paracoccaceae bacterium]